MYHLVKYKKEQRFSTILIISTAQHHHLNSSTSSTIMYINKHINKTVVSTLVLSALCVNAGVISTTDISTTTPAPSTTTTTTIASSVPTSDPVYPCNDTFDVTKEFNKTSVNIIQTATYYNVSSWNNVTEKLEYNKVPFNLSGTMTLINGCYFQLSNFTFTPFVQTLWYGKEQGNYTIGDPISNWSILENFNKTNLVYYLMEGKSFSTFNSIILYSYEMGLQLGYAQFPRAKNSTKKNNGTRGIADGSDTNDYGSGAFSGRNNVSSRWLIFICSLLVGVISIVF